MALKFICLLTVFTLFNRYQLILPADAIACDAGFHHSNESDDESACVANNALTNSEGEAAWDSTGTSAEATTVGATGASSEGSEGLMGDAVPTGTNPGAANQNCLPGTPIKGHKDCKVDSSARPDQCGLNLYTAAIETISQNGNDVSLGGEADKAKIQRVGKGKMLTRAIMFSALPAKGPSHGGLHSFRGSVVTLDKLGIEPQTGTKTKPVPLPDTFNIAP